MTPVLELLIAFLAGMIFGFCFLLVMTRLSDASTQFGKTYILKREQYIPPPEHFNCRCTFVNLKESKR